MASDGACGHSMEADSSEFRCVLCGICCSVYQVCISHEEAASIAAHMSMDFYEWVGMFCDPRWHDARSYLIRHDVGRCIFLRRGENRRIATCGIYQFRPSSCRDWEASLNKPECIEGLRRYWKVGVDADGNVCGSAVSMARLRAFLASDTLPANPD